MKKERLRSQQGLGFQSPSPGRSERGQVKEIHKLLDDFFDQDAQIFIGDTCHVFSVSLGSGGGLLSVPNGLHLGQVGAVLE